MHTDPRFASCNAPVVLPPIGDGYQVSDSNIPPYRGPYRGPCRPKLAAAGAPAAGAPAASAPAASASAAGGDEGMDEGMGEAMGEMGKVWDSGEMSDSPSSSQRHASLVPLTADEYDDAIYDRLPPGKRRKRRRQQRKRGPQLSHKRKRSKGAEEWELPVGDSQTPVEIARAVLEAQESEEERAAEEEAEAEAEAEAEEEEEKEEEAAGWCMSEESEDEIRPPKQQQRGAAQSSRVARGKRQTAAVNYKESGSAESVSDSD